MEWSEADSQFQALQRQLVLLTQSWFKHDKAEVVKEMLEPQNRLVGQVSLYPKFIFLSATRSSSCHLSRGRGKRNLIKEERGARENTPNTFLTSRHTTQRHIVPPVCLSFCVCSFAPQYQSRLVTSSRLQLLDEKEEDIPRALSDFRH